MDGGDEGVLTGRFGVRWTTQWAQAGFINRTTRIPDKIEDRIALAGRLVAFFTVDPTYEVPTMQVTAAHGTTVQNAALAAQLALTHATRTQATLSQGWTDASTALSDKMWALIKILQATLADDDTRWLAFGLPMPAAPSTPGQPLNVSARQDAQGNILVQCDAVSLASAPGAAAKPAATTERAAVKSHANGNGHSNGQDRPLAARMT